VKIDKKTSIELRGDAEEAYEKLNKIICQQKSEGKENSDEIKLWNGIQRAFDLMKEIHFMEKTRRKISFQNIIVTIMA
jgi:hypothetical protein